MGDWGCIEAVDLLNVMFDPRVLRRHGDALAERLARSEPLPDILVEVGKEIGRITRPAVLVGVEKVANKWPESHAEALRAVLLWALSTSKTDNPIRLRWKGDADYPETVTKFELKDNELVIEFAHPPALATRLSA